MNPQIPVRTVALVGFALTVGGIVYEWRQYSPQASRGPHPTLNFAVSAVGEPQIVV